MKIGVSIILLLICCALNPPNPAQAICDECLFGEYRRCTDCAATCCNENQDRCCCMHVDVCKCVEP